MATKYNNTFLRKTTKISKTMGHLMIPLGMWCMPGPWRRLVTSDEGDNVTDTGETDMIGQLHLV